MTKSPEIKVNPDVLKTLRKSCLCGWERLRNAD
jgi:hypothetical protein